MSKITRILGLSLFCACGLAVGSASAQILPGNVWPNPDFSTVAPAGIDQVYSYYNGSPSEATGGTYQPYTSGDTNIRPEGWHRGNGDFGVTTTPTYCFYDTPDASSEGSPPTPSPSGYALEINDNLTTNSGEWFSDWNALPAASVNGASPVEVQFLWAYTNLASTQRPQDNFRVTVNWGDTVTGDIHSDSSNLGHVDYNLFIPGTVDQTNWALVDETLTPPAGAQSMRITVDSGGSAQATGQIWVANMSVASVPEPASLSLVAVGALMLVRRRRHA